MQVASLTCDKQVAVCDSAGIRSNTKITMFGLNAGSHVLPVELHSLFDSFEEDYVYLRMYISSNKCGWIWKELQWAGSEVPRLDGVFFPSSSLTYKLYQDLQPSFP